MPKSIYLFQMFSFIEETRNKNNGVNKNVKSIARKCTTNQGLSNCISPRPIQSGRSVPLTRHAFQLKTRDDCDLGLLRLTIVFLV